MYEQLHGHFGLQHTPFPVSATPKKFFAVPAHDEAQRQLLFAIQSNKGLMLLTGEPGTGKSTILHRLVGVLKRDGYSTAYVFHTLLSSVGVLRVILNDFGISCPSNEKSELLLTLKTWLMKRHQMRDRPVILIDEAQALADRTLDDLRMLLNLEVSGANLVQLVLAGQPELETKLRSYKLKQLRQRVMCHCRLPGLSFEETTGYIRARLNEAGARSQEVFSQEALEEIYHYSQGNLRVIHLLCEHSLIRAYSAGRELVSDADISQVAREYELDGKADLPKEGLDALSGLVSSWKVDEPAPISQSKTETGLPTEFASPVETAVFEAAAVQAERPSDVILGSPSAEPQIATTDEPELPLTLARAAFLVASEKIGAIDKRRRDAVDSILEAGRSVVWLGREHQLKLLPKAMQKSIVASAAMADVARAAAEVPASETPKAFPSIVTPAATEATHRQAEVHSSVGPKPRAFGSAGPDDKPHKVSSLPTQQAVKAIDETKIGRAASENTSGLSQYWQSVGASLRRDVRQFLEQCGMGRDGRREKRAPPG